MIKVSAPAKVHLIGEHVVVYGEPAIISAVGLRTKCSFEKRDDNKIQWIDKRWDDDDTWDLEDVMSKTDEAKSLWNLCSEKKDFSELFVFGKDDNYRNYRKYVLGTVMKELDISSGFTLTVESDIPVGSGLGSSASLAVCIAKGLSELFEKSTPVEEVNRLAYECEKLSHGTPSGGDNSACCYGGLVWFVKGTPPIVKSLKEEIPHRLENFVLVYTDAPEKTTGELVQLVRDKPEEIRDSNVKEIGRMTEEMKTVLANKDYEKMKEFINKTQECLSSLGISTEKIDSLVSSIREIGGAAKLCGAGGGGIVLCWSQNLQELKEKISSLGYKPMEAELSAEGARSE